MTKYKKDFKVELKKLEYLYNNMTSTLLATLFITILTFYTLIDYSDNDSLTLWLSLNVLTLSIRAILYRRFKNTKITDININKYFNLFFITVTISSLFWAILPFYFFPNILELQIIVLLMVAGVATGATVSLASKKYLSKIFIFFTMFPYIYFFSTQNIELKYQITIAAIVYTLFLFLISKKVSTVIINSILLEFENIDLIDRLEAKVDEANKANEAKSKFLSVMSHEIRTPLNAIIGFIKILKKDEKDLTKQNYLETIDKSSALLTNIINDILDISKIEAGKLSIEHIDFNPSEELLYIYELYSKTSIQKNVKIINSISDDLPDTIVCDMLKLKQVISNLLSNAIKFTPEGNSIEFIAKFNKENSSLYIEIKDEGIGIKPENIKNITKEFMQADDSTSRKYGGTGLGLAIATRLLKLQNSELKIKSKIDVGSSFYFELPVEVIQKKELTTSKEYEEIDFKNKKVLVAEDNKTNQMLIKILLEDLNLDVSIANDGLEAENIYKEEKFNLILMDINMPNKNGYEAMISIKEYDSSSIIIAVTANSISGDKEKYLEDGFDDYISKPIDMDELEGVLSKHLI